MTASAIAARPLPPLAYVLAGGLAAGALDISYAWLFWAVKAGPTAQRIFQSVAAGLLGKASFAGGWPTALLGLGLHFSIATSMPRRPWKAGPSPRTYAARAPGKPIWIP